MNNLDAFEKWHNGITASEGRPPHPHECFTWYEEQIHKPYERFAIAAIKEIKIELEHVRDVLGDMVSTINIKLLSKVPPG